MTLGCRFGTKLGFGTCLDTTGKMAAVCPDRIRRNRLIAFAVAAGDNFLRHIMDEDSDSDDEMSEFPILEAKLRLRGRRRKPPRIGGYIENTVPRFSSQQFRQHFRMVPRTFEILENRLGPALVPEAIEGRPRIAVRTQLLSILWLIATPDSYRSVGDRFDLGKSSVRHYFHRVVEALNNIAQDILVWPRGAKLAANKEAFRRIANLPDVIGAIDGTHIEIKAPRKDPQFYITRKKRFAITLQAVCDPYLQFTDCFVGFAGSVGDLRVLRNSDLWAGVRRNRDRFFPEQEYIIGDKAYPVLSWCIPPYRNLGNMTPAQQMFNQVHARTRQVIERSFALLKGRFRRLKYLDMNRDDEIPYVILACCVLHNICLEGHLENIEDYVEEGYVNDEHNEIGERIENLRLEHDGEGVAKRDHLTALVAQM